MHLWAAVWPLKGLGRVAAPTRVFEANWGRRRAWKRAQGRCAKKQPAMCLSSKKYTGKVNAFEMKNGAESWAHFEWTWTEAITFRYATTGITGT